MTKKVRCGTCRGEFDKPGWIGVPHPSGDPKKRKYIKCWNCNGKGMVKDNA